MIIPERFLAGHLMWTRTGDVWATWRLDPLPRPVTEVGASEPTATHTALQRGLVGHEFLLEGLLTWTDPVAVVDRMLRRVDLAENPMWAAEADATIDQLQGEPLGEREWFLSVRLTKVDGKIRSNTIHQAALNVLLEAGGLSPLRPTAAAVAAYRDAADLLARNLPTEFNVRPASESEQVWLRRHLQTRHADFPDSPAGADCGDVADVIGRSAFGALVLDEGGTTDLSNQQRAGLTKHLMVARYLKVVDDSDRASYQAGYVLSHLPKQMSWPTTEFLARIDDSGVPLDIAIRGTVRSRHQALRSNQKAIKQLTDQLHQTADADEHHAGTMMRLGRAAEVLGEYNADMEALDREVEIEPVIMVSIAAPTVEVLDTLVDQFAQAPLMEEFTWVRPMGAQRDIFQAMRPGATMSRRIRDYRQLTRSGVFAQTLPVTQHRLGRPDGIPMAINESSALLSMVFLDLVDDARSHDASPTLAVVGEQGSGKSMFQKRLCGAFVARGGRMIATDNSTEREWVHFAQALDVDVAVVDTADPVTSIDPLRVLPPAQAGPVTQSFLITLLDVTATDALGQTIAKVLRPTYLAEHQITSLGKLQRHLADGCTLTGAIDIADRIGVFASLEGEVGLARAVFDESLPAIDIDARAIIIATSNLELPSATELSNDHLFRQMGVGKIFGRAFYALVGRLAKEVCFADRSDPAIFDVDEAHHMTTSPEATQVLKDFVRFGRRQMAAFVIGTHDPVGDIPDDTVRGLIKHRLVLRLTDRDLSKGGARFLGIDPDTSPAEFAEFTEQIRTFSTPGAGLYRDRLGRVGTVRLLMPATPAHREAARTTPPTKERVS